MQSPGLVALERALRGGDGDGGTTPGATVARVVAAPSALRLPTDHGGVAVGGLACESQACAAAMAAGRAESAAKTAEKAPPGYERPQRGQASCRASQSRLVTPRAERRAQMATAGEELDRQGLASRRADP